MNKLSAKPLIKFTGERMIPVLNKGKSLYYEHLIRYIFAAQFAKNKNVLDLGCGTGYGSYLVSKAGASKVVGIDITPEAIEYAKANFKRNNIVFKVGDIQNIPQQEKVDLAVAFEVIEHINNQQKFLEQISQKLHNNGILIISTPNKDKSTQVNPFHTKEFDLKEFKKILNKYFQYIYLFGQSFSFANTINPEISTNRELSLKNLDIFESKTIDSFMTKPKLSNAMYLIALCSNKPIRQIQSTILMSNQVDEFSLEQSIEGLTKKFVIERNNEIAALYNKTSKILKEKNTIQNELNIITHSKFFILWSIYSKCKKLLNINLRGNKGSYRQL